MNFKFEVGDVVRVDNSVEEDTYTKTVNFVNSMHTDEPQEIVEKDYDNGEYCYRLMNGYWYHEDWLFPVEEGKTKIRGFEFVTNDKIKYEDEVESVFHSLPVRGDSRSAGYDFFSPINITIQPNSQELIWTNVKAYMQEDEVLNIYVRSSIGIKRGLTLANAVGIIDSSYYSNPDNDGNIGICLRNNTDKPVSIKAGERIAQGIFQKYLVADNDTVLNKERIGGIGSSGK